MFEFLFGAVLVSLYLPRRARKKLEKANKLAGTGKKVRGLDAELKAIISEDVEKNGIASEIKQYLLSVIEDDKNDIEKFSTQRLDQAQDILDRAGPSAMFWMTDIAAQLAFLAAAQVNGIPTNVGAEVGESATPEAIVNVVVLG
ncbi:MAG: hypothetical protein QNL49_01245 [Actinomycetota bacterium]|jgi:hypothetical protein